MPTPVTRYHVSLHACSSCLYRLQVAHAGDGGLRDDGRKGELAEAFLRFSVFAVFPGDRAIRCLSRRLCRMATVAVASSSSSQSFSPVVCLHPGETKMLPGFSVSDYSWELDFPVLCLPFLLPLRLPDTTGILTMLSILLSQYAASCLLTLASPVRGFALIRLTSFSLFCWSHDFLRHFP